MHIPLTLMLITTNNNMMYFFAENYNIDDRLYVSPYHRKYCIIYVIRPDTLLKKVKEFLEQN